MPARKYQVVSPLTFGTFYKRYYNLVDLNGQTAVRRKDMDAVRETYLVEIPAQVWDYKVARGKYDLAAAVQDNGNAKPVPAPAPQPKPTPQESLAEELTFGMPADTPSNWPCCGVAAVAMETGVSFNKAYETMRQVGGKRRNWKGKSNLPMMNGTVQKLGKTPVEVSPKKRVALKTWVRQTAKKNTLYRVLTSGHAQVVYNGKVYDQGNPEGADIEEFWGKNKRVDTVYTSE